MRMSRFNVTVKLGDQVIIYNTLSGGMLKLDEEYTKTLKRIQETGILCEREFKENLLKGRMIVEEEFDEIKYLKAQNNIKIKNSYGSNMSKDYPVHRKGV